MPLRIGLQRGIKEIRKVGPFFCIQNRGGATNTGKVNKSKGLGPASSQYLALIRVRVHILYTGNATR